MIGSLRGRMIARHGPTILFEVAGVGYELFCTPQTQQALVERPDGLLFVHSHYRNEGVALYGFLEPQEKDLFLELIKVDSVGPKSALQILSGACWEDLVHLIEEGDVKALSQLQRVSKKVAEHLVVKLKGKLKDVVLKPAEMLIQQKTSVDRKEGEPKREKLQERMKFKDEVRSTLTHLGYAPQEIENALREMDDKVWETPDFEAVIRSALGLLA